MMPNRELLPGEKCLAVAAPTLALGAIPMAVVVGPIGLVLPIWGSLLLVAILSSLRVRFRWEAVMAFLLFALGVQVLLVWWLLRGIAAD